MDPMSTYSWLIFALGTVLTWGLYGIFLHMGQMGMVDPVNGRYKAFLFVGVAYFLTAVLAPLILLVMRGADWSFPAKGLWLSLFAGILGAIGAFFVLLALGDRREGAECARCRDVHHLRRSTHRECDRLDLDGARLGQDPLALHSRALHGGRRRLSCHEVQAGPRRAREAGRESRGGRSGRAAILVRLRFARPLIGSGPA